MNEIIWSPQEGPQVALVNCPIKEIMFGGARGGGKSDGMLGKNAIKAEMYGEHQHGLFIRRNLKQLEDAVARAHQIYGASGLGWKWQEQKMTYTSPKGATLKFRYLDRDIDAQQYQGHSYCVAVDTDIVMGDKTTKKMSEISVGDKVMTLEGPKKVLRITDPYIAECSRIKTKYGEQVQPLTHPVLTNVSKKNQQSHDDNQNALQSQPFRTPWISVLPHPCVDRDSKVESSLLKDEQIN